MQKKSLIDRKYFDEYYQNEKLKTLLIYKIFLCIFLVINTIFILFVIAYRIQISSVNSDIISMLN